MLLALLGWAYLACCLLLDRLPLAGRTLCPFHLLTGVPCPLCGTSRAWNAALRADLHAAFSHHAVAPLLLPIWLAITIGLTVRVCARHETRRQFLVPRS